MLTRRSLVKMTLASLAAAGTARSAAAQANLGFVMTVGGLEAKVTAEARAIAQARLLGTTDPTLQDDMLKLARSIYK
jgi:hypothetical protein